MSRTHVVIPLVLPWDRTVSARLTAFTTIHIAPDNSQGLRMSAVTMPKKLVEAAEHLAIALGKVAPEALLRRLAGAQRTSWFIQECSQGWTTMANSSGRRRFRQLKLVWTHASNMTVCNLYRIWC